MPRISLNHLIFEINFVQIDNRSEQLLITRKDCLFIIEIYFCEISAISGLKILEIIPLPKTYLPLPEQPDIDWALSNI